MEFKKCYACGISEQKARLFDALSLKERGVVKICENCSKKEDMPIVKKPTTEQLKEAEKRPRYFGGARISKQQEYEKSGTETTLREIIDRNYKSSISPEKKPRPDLVDNFHWLIMVERRKKKLTQEQLAKEIVESEAAIKMAEQGFLPEDDYKLISKLESFLGVKIRKSKNIETSKSQPARILKFDPNTFQNIKIDDLRKMKANSEEEQENYQENYENLEEKDR